MAATVSFATINVITRKADRGNSTAVRMETDTLGERHISLTQSLNLPRGYSLLLSGSAFNDLGQHDIVYRRSQHAGE